MFSLSVTKGHRVTSGSEATVRAIWLTQSSAVRVGPIVGITTVPCATSQSAINVRVPRRIYANARRLARLHQPGGMLTLQGVDASHFVCRQHPLTGFDQGGRLPIQRGQ